MLSNDEAATMDEPTEVALRPPGSVMDRRLRQRRQQRLRNAVTVSEYANVDEDNEASASEPWKMALREMSSEPGRWQSLRTAFSATASSNESDRQLEGEELLLALSRRHELQALSRRASELHSKLGLKRMEPEALRKRATAAKEAQEALPDFVPMVSRNSSRATRTSGEGRASSPLASSSIRPRFGMSASDGALVDATGGSPPSTHMAISAIEIDSGGGGGQEWSVHHYPWRASGRAIYEVDREAQALRRRVAASKSAPALHPGTTSQSSSRSQSPTAPSNEGKGPEATRAGTAMLRARVRRGPSQGGITQEEGLGADGQLPEWLERAIEEESERTRRRQRQQHGGRRAATRELTLSLPTKEPAAGAPSSAEASSKASKPKAPLVTFSDDLWTALRRPPGEVNTVAVKPWKIPPPPRPASTPKPSRVEEGGRPAWRPSGWGEYRIIGPQTRDARGSTTG